MSNVRLGTICYNFSMKSTVYEVTKAALSALGLPIEKLRIDYPENPDHGDFTTNIALVVAKEAKMAPVVVAKKIIEELNKNKPSAIASIDIAGPGFINFKMAESSVIEQTISASENSEFGISTQPTGRKVMVEYTDPNPFKVFHIGHLMANAIGESMSRLVQFGGNEVIRVTWQGDVGLHVAKAIWAYTKIQSAAGEDAVAFWGRAYTHGNTAYETDPAAKAEIDTLNKTIYNRSDAKINEIYDKGRADSLVAFDAIYARLGSKFERYFFEGTEGRKGEPIIREFMKKGIFEESEGAIVFKGEKYGLHTRVFITSKGLPTYETKELGLNSEKFRLYPDLAESIIVTGNEQTDYFRVLLQVMNVVYPEIGAKTKHFSHGLLRFASGKMSSRKGTIVTAEDLIENIRALVREKIAERKFSDAEADEISDIIAIGAIKYSILRQSVGSDVIFDSASSISFEGDSGPYLQYAAVRANSILDKAQKEEAGSRPKVLSGSEGKQGEHDAVPEIAGHLERLLLRFPDIIERARTDYAPQIVAGYLIQLAAAFNAFYASQVILDPANPLSSYYIKITQLFATVMKNGLWVLGIRVPKKM